MEHSTSHKTHRPTSQRRHVLCVTTSKPSTAASIAGGGGALTMICPSTGSISGSLAISGDLSSTTQAVSSSNHSNSQQQQQHQLGISSLSLYSPRISNQLHPTQAPLALAYGQKARGSNTNDCAAMLVSLVSHNPKVHWKARLPEAPLSAGVVLSKCGHYAIGGGASGALYVWSTLQGGHLLKTIHRAHYRAVTCLHMTGDQRHVLTGGADGMVHLFAWMDLVETPSSSKRGSTKQKTVVPIRTWSQHTVPITSLESVSDYRMVSASQDGLIHVFETFSEAVVATVQLPQGVSSLAVRNQRIWVGGSLGTLYCLDLDVYAMHQTIQLGASIGNHNRQQGGLRHHQQVQTQMGNKSPSGSVPAYKTTLKGHQHPVTSMALWADDEGQEFLVSGDASGTLRVWDLGGRVCVRIVRPWSNSATDGPAPSKSTKAGGNPKKKANVPQHTPVSSIHVLEVATDNTNMNTMTGPISKAKGGASAWTSRLPALQKYAPSHEVDPESAAAQTRWTTVPIWNRLPRDDVFWDISKIDYEAGRKRPRLATGEAVTSKVDEVRQLKKQLEEANAAVARFETMNNQLKAKLNQE